MASVKIVQNSFTQGELGNYMDAREDLPLYKAGAKKIENWLVLPQGGLLRRAGFEFLDDNPATASTDTGNDTGFATGSRLFTFSFSTDQEYCLIFEVDASTPKLHVYRNGFHAATISGGECFWTTKEIVDEIRTAQTFDSMILVHEDFTPRRITRSSHTSWSIAKISHDFIPLANFDTGVKITPTHKDASGTLSVNTGTVADILATNDRVRLNGGIIKITNASTGAYDIVENLTSIDQARSTEWEQSVFNDSNDSSTNGYPRSVTFHQNRLIYGGTKLKPQTIFGSQSGDFFNFKPTVSTTDDSGNTTGSVTDDSALSFTIGSDQVNIIRHVVSKKSLFVFTTGGEFEMTGNPLTPTNVNIQLQTRYGHTSGGINPTTVDNEILFITSNKREMRGFVFDYNSDTYYAKNYTVIAHDVLDNPQDQCLLRGYKNTNNNFLFVVNSDGELAVLSINVEKQVVGWSRFTTLGSFKRVTPVFDKQLTGGSVDTTKPEIQRLYALVERTYINNDSTQTTALFLERLTEDDVYLDSYQQEASASHSTLQNLMPLAGQTVGAVTNGFVHSNVTVTARTDTPNAAVTLSDSSANTQIGHYYTSTMQTMTFPVQINGAPQRGEQIQKVSTLVNLFNTKQMKVDGTGISFQSTTTTLGASIPAFTGTKKLTVGGQSTDPNLIITVDQPLPATLLGLTTKVSVTVE
jgi:hypothetical protein